MAERMALSRITCYRLPAVVDLALFGRWVDAGWNAFAGGAITAVEGGAESIRLNE